MSLVQAKLALFEEMKDAVGVASAGLRNVRLLDVFFGGMWFGGAAITKGAQGGMFQSLGSLIWPIVWGLFKSAWFVAFIGCWGRTVYKFFAVRKNVRLGLLSIPVPTGLILGWVYAKSLDNTKTMIVWSILAAMAWFVGGINPFFDEPM